MSRRHRETENETIKSHQAESYEDGRLRDQSNEMSASNKLSSVFSGLQKINVVRKTKSYLAEKISQAIYTALGNCTIEVDDTWVKIPRSLFNVKDIEILEQFCPNVNSHQEESSRKENRGRKTIKQLFSKFSDSKFVQYFRDTWNAAKEIGVSLYEEFTSFCSTFFIASNKVFSPDDDPYGYGKVSHYYEVILPEIKKEMANPFTREWLNGKIRWFEYWRPAVTYEDRRAKKERRRHRVWEELIEWVQSYLKYLAPEYALAY